MARDPVTGRFTKIKTANTPESGKGGFETYADGLPVVNASGAPSPATIERPRHAPDRDGPVPGPGDRLRARRPEMVHPDDSDHTVYGRQGAVLRTAARDSGPCDPTRYLVGGES